MKPNAMFSKRAQRGFSMMEVLIAMLVLSIGLLGLAALQTQGMRFNNEAYFRTQATQLAYQVIDIMRADRDNLANYINSEDDLEDLQDTVVCSETSVDSDVQLVCWMDRLTGVLPEAAASIVANASNADYVDVTISWADRELSASTLEAAKTQTTCESQPNRSWDATAGAAGDLGVCRINQIWTVYP